MSLDPEDLRNRARAIARELIWKFDNQEKAIQEWQVDTIIQLYIKKLQEMPPYDTSQTIH